MEIVRKAKDTFLKNLKKFFYSGTDFKDLYTKSTNSSWDKYIRFYIKYIFNSEIFR